MTEVKTTGEETAKDFVVVTGFGPFRDHLLNPSWEAIRDGRLQIDRPVQLITKQIRVSYSEVDEVVENLWKEYKPILVVHVGLAAFEKRIRIEQVGRHGPYVHDDVLKYAPHENLRQYTVGEGQERQSECGKFTCKPCSFESSRTCFNVERVCDKLNELAKQGTLSLPFRTSSDAGLYVCEYTFQKSLRICDRAVFIHVPDIGEEFRLEDITKALKYSIEYLIDELNEIQD